VHLTLSAEFSNSDHRDSFLHRIILTFCESIHGPMRANYQTSCFRYSRYCVFRWSLPNRHVTASCADHHQPVTTLQLALPKMFVAVGLSTLCFRGLSFVLVSHPVRWFKPRAGRELAIGRFANFHRTLERSIVCCYQSSLTYGRIKNGWRSVIISWWERWSEKNNARQLCVAEIVEF
jgi:hypothetical protein